MLKRDEGSVKVGESVALIGEEASGVPMQPLFTWEEQSELRIHGDFLRIQFPYPPPCWFHRFWQRALLGWEWRDLRGQGDEQ